MRYTPYIGNEAKLKYVTVLARGHIVRGLDSVDLHSFDGWNERHYNLYHFSNERHFIDLSDYAVNYLPEPVRVQIAL